MLIVNDLNIRYGTKQPILKGLNLELPKSSICLVSGDGYGKTTLCLAIAGLLAQARPEAVVAGQITYNNKLITHSDFNEDIAITLENPYAQITGLKRTVFEEIAFSLEMRGVDRLEIRSKVNRTTDIIGISHLLDRNPSTLSGGETQKVVMACSHVTSPKLWVLDNPLVELDPNSRILILNELKRIANETGAIIIIAEKPANDVKTITSHVLSINEDNTATLSLNTCHNNSAASNLKNIIQYTTTRVDNNFAPRTSLPSLSIRNATFRYQTENPIFDNLCIEVGSGDCLWITGPNGAGKTTLAKLIAGIIKLEAGDILINGNSVVDKPIWNIARYVSYAFQNPDIQIFSTDVWSEVSFGPNALGYETTKCEYLANHYLNLFGLSNQKRTHPHDLSRAERKRLGLASTFAMDTPIIILDEPTQYQNLHFTNIIRSAITDSLKAGKIVICITHDFLKI